MLDSAAEELAPKRSPAGVVEALARETLQRATEEFEADEGGRPALPDKPMTTGMVSFFFEPGVFLRCLALTIALHVELGLISSAVAAFSGGPLQQFLCALLCAGSIVMGMAVVLTGSVMLLAVLQDTANGKDEIDSWPQGFFMDWLFEGLYVAVALFLGVLPGVLAGQFVLCAGGAATVYAVALAVCSGVTLLVLFPVMLLSLLEAGSPFVPVSRPIWRSLSIARPRWVQFYALSVVLAMAGLVILLGFRRGGVVLDFLVLFFVTALSMIYFRLLGRLAWCCREAVAEPVSPEAAPREAAS
jgi:MFS family permease